jgi:hypothetical protein
VILAGMIRVLEAELYSRIIFTAWKGAGGAS